MKYILIIALLLPLLVTSQTKPYKEYDVCIDSAVYKGKKNHGKYHCVSYMVVREYKDGNKDTVLWVLGGSKAYFHNEYEQYQLLPERGKYIIDSLKEDGIPMFHNDYLVYEPIYMKPGKKTYKSWIIKGNDIHIYYYSIWKSSKGHGFELVKEIRCK